MERITERDLKAVCDRINRATNSPLESYTKVSGYRYRANIGNYHLSAAYGGWNLERMVNEGGGVQCVFSHGYIPKRELYQEMHAFLRGIEAARSPVPDEPIATAQESEAA